MATQLLGGTLADKWVWQGQGKWDSRDSAQGGGGRGVPVVKQLLGGMPADKGVWKEQGSGPERIGREGSCWGPRWSTRECGRGRARGV